MEYSEPLIAIATVVLAAFTAWMAFETKKLAEEGRDSSVLMELHHQERLAPILQFYPDPIGGFPGGIQFDWWNDPQGCRCQIRGMLHNSGLGPALNIKLIITIPNYFLPITFIAPPVGSLEKQEYFREYLSTDFNFTDCAFLESNQGIWEMRIEYTDLFGNPYLTQLVNDPHKENKKISYNSPERFFRNRNKES